MKINLATIFKTKDGYYYNTDKNNLKIYFSDELNFFNQKSLSDKIFNIDSLGNIISFSRSSFGKVLPLAIKVKSPDSLGSAGCCAFESGQLIMW